MKKTILYAFLTILLMIVSTGCASGPTRLELVIKSDSEINLDKDNISSPLMLNFYELDSAEQFSKLDYWSIIDNGAERLNSDLISQNKHIIVPSEQHTYKIMFNERAKFLGIIANFRKLDTNASWKYIVNLDTGSNNDVELEIKDYTIKEAK